MAASDQKTILLNLAGELGNSLKEQLIAAGVEILEESDLDQRTPGFILVRDYKSVMDFIAQNYVDASIVSLAPVDDITAFAEKNGKAIINPQVLSCSVALPLLQRLFNSQVSAKLEMNFGALLENCMSLKISGHMHVGHLTDLVVNDAFSRDFRAISLRAFLTFLSTYIAYLEQGGICQYPFDINYGATHDSYIVEVVVPANRFFLQYIYPALGELNPQNPLEYLLGQCLSMSDCLSITQLKNAGKLIISSIWHKRDVPPAFPSLTICAIDSVKAFERGRQELKRPPTIELSLSTETLTSNEAKSLPGPGIKPVHIESKQHVVENETEVLIKGTQQEKESYTTVKGRFEADESKVVIKGDNDPRNLTAEMIKIAGLKKQSDQNPWTLKKLDSMPDPKLGILNDKRGKTIDQGQDGLEGTKDQKGLFESVEQLVNGSEDARDFNEVALSQRPIDGSETGTQEHPLQVELNEKNVQLNRMKPLMNSMRDQMMAMLKKTKVTQLQIQTMNDTIDQLREELQEAKNKTSESEYKLRMMESQVTGTHHGKKDVEIEESESALADLSREKKLMEDEILSLKSEALQKDKIVQTQSRHFFETIAQLKRDLEATKEKLGERDFKMREMEARLSRREKVLDDNHSNVNKIAENMVPISTVHDLQNELRLIVESDTRKSRQIDLLQAQLADAHEKAEAMDKQYKIELNRVKEAIPQSASLDVPVPAPAQTIGGLDHRTIMSMTDSLRDKDILIGKLNVDLKQSELRQKELTLEVKKLEQKMRMTLAQLQSAEKLKGKKGSSRNQTPIENQLQHKVRQLETANASLADQQKHMLDEINEKKKELIKLKQEINTLQNTNSILERKLQGKEKAA
ncbi:MAG: hypothetical protein HYV97_02865 [Bdellovibrio sp.]|nr:hypothetical protein [Bdellovibrio sp.]